MLAAISMHSDRMALWMPSCYWINRCTDRDETWLKKCGNKHWLYYNGSVQCHFPLLCLILTNTHLFLNGYSVTHFFRSVGGVGTRIRACVLELLQRQCGFKSFVVGGIFILVFYTCAPQDLKYYRHFVVIWN